MTRSEPPVMHLRALLAVVLALAVTGCGRDVPVGGHGQVRGVATSHPTTHGLTWWALPARPHAFLDAVDRAALSVGIQPLEVAKALAVAAPGAPAIQARLALARLAQADGAGGLGQVFSVATELAEKAPDHPDRLYLDGYLRWVVASAGARAGGGSGAQAREGMRASWRRLLEVAPDYVGPGGADARWIRGRLGDGDN